MWGYNEKIKQNNLGNKNKSMKDVIDNNGLTREEIIQNKLKIFKDKIYKPFWDKVEKEKKMNIKEFKY